MSTTIDRRGFLSAAGRVGAGLCIAMALPLGMKPADRAAAAAEETTAPFAPNAWLRIAPDETVTVMVSKSEMGQGIATGFCTIAADELDAPFSNVRFEFAPAAPEYIDAPFIGDQTTGGSESTGGEWMTLRQAGATGRAMLIAAAAKQWNVDPSTCTASKGIVSNAASGKTASYGSLASAAALMPVPNVKDVVLKTPDKFTIIGTHVQRVDTPLKVNGKAKYGIDTVVPGMVYATVVRPPVFGGSVASFDATKAKQVHGVLDVVEISTGVAIVGTNTWATRQGREALHVMWNDGPNAQVNSKELLEKAHSLVATAHVAKKVGDVSTAQGKTIASTFEVPFLSHAPMEPMNATADVRADSCEVWAPTQVQTRSLQTAMKITGLPAEKVKIHTTFLGGGFGRRLDIDYVTDAVEVSKKMGKPVKVTWPREEDIQHDFYRPMQVNALRGTVDADGKLVALSHTVVADSIAKRWLPPAFKDGIDPLALDSVWNVPYEIANVEFKYIDLDSPVPVGFMRAPGANANTFAMEIFMDELAHAAHKDPVAFRMATLGKSVRAAAVLAAAAKGAGWGKKMPAGHAQGVALCAWGGSFGALVCDVSLDAKKQPVVHSTVMAVDTGITVNPDIVRMQVQGAVNYGLAMARSAKITIAKGRVEQSNFYDYTVLRNENAPDTRVIIVPSTEKPTGIGELGTPPIAPAIANAVFKLTGKRIRKMPFTDALA